MKSILILLMLLTLPQATTRSGQDRDGFTPLFDAEGVPEGWVVTEWSDVAVPVEEVQWAVTGGILRSGERRGTWLISEREYGDFILELEIKLTELGNSGIALRTPMKGDPAFDGLELQVADVRYNPEAKSSELTGGLYRAVPPAEQAFKPQEWNRLRIELSGPRLKASLNGKVIQDITLDAYDEPIPRHDGTMAPPIKDRPRRGHIGFQHLSRDGAVEIRNVRIKELK
jgi:hypothetical protein